MVPTLTETHNPMCNTLDVLKPMLNYFSLFGNQIKSHISYSLWFITSYLLYLSIASKYSSALLPSYQHTINNFLRNCISHKITLIDIYWYFFKLFRRFTIKEYCYRTLINRTPVYSIPRFTGPYFRTCSFESEIFVSHQETPNFDFAS